MNKLFLVLIIILLITGCNNNEGIESNSNVTKECIEPQNSYDEDTGHYAGFEWAMNNNGNCDGNSDSFNEGCKEYFNQLNMYNQCVAEKR